MPPLYIPHNDAAAAAADAAAIAAATGSCLCSGGLCMPVACRLTAYALAL